MRATPIRLLALAAGALLLPRAGHAQGTPPPAAPADTTAPAGAAAPAAPTDTAAPESGDTAAPASGDTAAPADAPADSAAGWGSLADVAPERVFDTRFYGYIDSYFEYAGATPTGAQNSDGTNAFDEGGYGWDVLNLHAMVQGTILSRYRFFMNLAARAAGTPATETPIGVRNAWVEAPIIGNLLQVRAGLTYRRFGLYNEILDATPTFIGIEPPELFDVDHLMLTRTTNFMVHGSVPVGPALLSYALNTGDDERADKAVPFGGDVRLDVGSWLRLGTSFYWTGGDAVPTRAVGSGSPRGGVANWMSRDEYWVAGGYAQLHRAGLIVQMEFWNASHSATRDAASVMRLANAGLNPFQMRRFFVGGLPSGGVNTAANYNVQTFYTRIGYEIPLGDTATLTPYAQFDWYSNPETINARSFGGDLEAGLTDEGIFTKYTLGLVWRPTPQVAAKADGSIHVYPINGVNELAPELRISFSYLWELAP